MPGEGDRDGHPPPGNPWRTTLHPEPIPRHGRTTREQPDAAVQGPYTLRGARGPVYLSSEAALIIFPRRGVFPLPLRRTTTTKYFTILRAFSRTI